MKFWLADILRLETTKSWDWLDVKLCKKYFTKYTDTLTTVYIWGKQKTRSSLFSFFLCIISCSLGSFLRLLINTISTSVCCFSLQLSSSIHFTWAREILALSSEPALSGCVSCGINRITFDSFAHSACCKNLCFPALTHSHLSDITAVSDSIPF